MDDILILGNDTALIDGLLYKLSTTFKIRDLGRPRFFLGIEAIYNVDGVVLSQHRYMMELLRKAGMESCKPLATPMSNATSKAATGSAMLDDPTPYRQLVGYPTPYRQLDVLTGHTAIFIICGESSVPVHAQSNRRSLGGTKTGSTVC